MRASLRHDFALAILDVQMPIMDGYELAEFLRNDEKTRHLPIIFLTAAFTHEMDAFRGYEAGAIDYITKPYNPVVLLSKVKMFLELDRQRAELHRQGVLLKVTNEELEAFAYSVSHDLRTPLRGMDGFSHALLEDYGDKLDAEGRDYLQRVRAASQKMAQLIDDLLKLSRVTRGEHERRKVDLSKLAQAVAAELQESVPERQVTFGIAPGVTAVGDARMIRIAFENLLGNAWKFTAKHDHATIEFGVADQDGKAAYFVRDDGAGFDMAYLRGLADLSEVERRHIVLELVDLPPDLPGFRIGKAIQTMRQVARTVMARVPIDIKNLDLWHGTGVHAVGFDLGALRTDQRALLPKLESFAAQAEKVELRKFIYGLDTISAVTMAVSAGFDYIEGEAVCAPVASIAHVRPFETEDLLAHLLP